MGAILITTSSFGVFDASVLAGLEQAGHTPVLNPHGRKLTADEVKELIKTHSPVGILAGVEPLRRDALELAPGLLAIARCGIGMDSVDLEAARDLGASEIQTLFRVIIPMALPGVASAFLTAVTLSLEDFVITFFVSGPGSTTLPLYIYSMIRFGVSPVVNALSAVMVAGTVLLVYPLRNFLKVFAAR